MKLSTCQVRDNRPNLRDILNDYRRVAADRDAALVGRTTLEAIAEAASHISVLWDSDSDDAEFCDALDSLRVLLRPWREHRIARAYTITESEWIEIDGRLVKRLPREKPDTTPK